MENEIRGRLMNLLGERLKRIGIDENELGNRFDLVKSGLVNSLEFVDLVASLEKEYRCEINFESGLEMNDLTTIGGLIRSFKSAING